MPWIHPRFFPDLLKFIRSKAVEAVTMAAMVEMPRILLWTSFMMLSAWVHISEARTWLVFRMKQ